MCLDPECLHVSQAAHAGLGSVGFTVITSLKDTPGALHFEPRGETKGEACSGIYASSACGCC